MFDKDSSVSVIGAGRLGSSLAVALSRGGIKVVAASTRRSSHREWLRERLPGALICETAGEAAAISDIALITTSDSAIEVVCEEIEWRSDQATVHCSGVLGLEPLRSAAQASAKVGAIHPLQTFPSHDSHRLLKGVTFAIESDDQCLEQWLRGVIDLFEGRPITISGPEQRAAYHASAVLACGLLAGLAGASAELWRSFDVERSEALKMMSPMIVSTAAEIAERGMPDALSGPYTRGDIETIQRHLAATKRHSIELSRAYASLALAQLHIASELGGIDATKQRMIVEMLENHLQSL